MQSLRLLAATLLLLVLGCFSKTMTWAPGPRDRAFEHPPYYVNYPADIREAAQRPNRVGYYAAWYQSGGVPFLSPKSGADTPVGKLLADMNAYLDSLADSLRLVPLGVAKTARPFIPPDVRFGCERGPDGCAATNGARVMRLGMDLPSSQWTGAHYPVLDSAGAGQALLIVLEVGNYWVAQTNLRGSKAVELGSGYVVPVPWLTSLDSPVSVLQLTGALVGRDAKAIRLGAEGIFARRTPFKLSALAPGSELTIRNEDVQEAASLRRDDLAGQPLAWRVALRTLVVQLSGVGP